MPDASARPQPKIVEKHWSRSLEPELYQRWKSSGDHRFDPSSGKPIFSIDTPPPYVNTPIHIGQAFTYVMMDMFARFHRMMGDEVLFPLGLDRNGLPIEIAAEKKFNVRLTLTPRREFIDLCQKVLEEASAASLESFLRLGVSYSSWEYGTRPGDAYLTDSPEFRALTQSTFIELFQRGLIYEAERINNFCPGCQTTIADAEVEYEEKESAMHELKFGVRETGESIVIGTTRPELIGSCAMVIFNPADSRYTHLDGKTAVTPVFNKSVPIRAHPQAQMDKGTGLVMMCSMGDLADIRFFREMRLEPVISIGADGKMNENAGPLKGLKVKEARKVVAQMLRDSGLHEKETKVVHRSPICERSKDSVEFISMRELYLKQVDLKDEMRRIAGEVAFFAPASRQILLDWIDQVSIDWPLTRRRFYATEVPIWYCTKCSAPVVPPKGKYYRPWCEPPPVSSCPKCGASGTGWARGDERVLDTWFDSSTTPLYILGYGTPDSIFETAGGCTVRPQGKEIVRTWLYYTLLKSHLLTSKTIFRDAWINMHIVDDKGEKMSKSKGNVIDPHKVLERFGAEPFRLWCAVEGDLTAGDLRCSFDRIDGAGKTLTKLWNVARFVSSFDDPPAPESIQPLDLLILLEAAEVAEFARERYAKYDFHAPVARLKNFLWETFASHYLELVKDRAYNENGACPDDESRSARWTLNRVLDTILGALAPVTPFVTARLFEELRARDIHKEPFPGRRALLRPLLKLTGEAGELLKDQGSAGLYGGAEGLFSGLLGPMMDTLMDQLVEQIAAKSGSIGFTLAQVADVNSAVWKAKKDAGKGMKDPVLKIVIPRALESIADDVKRAHRATSVEVGDAVAVEL
ncbi:MAG TPA: valine--tRNA ligase [Thermoplasmata archaeon]|nr:valine--tRNA ligase [Thermoplasmata archaeon]